MNVNSPILAGDIGGTKVVLTLYDPAPDGLRTLREATFHSREYATFDAMLEAFLGAGLPGAGLPGAGLPGAGLPGAGLPVSIAGACFGVAGAVVDGRVHVTNLPWLLEEGALAATIGTPRVRLVNDLAAAAFGMLYLAKGEFEVLQAGAAVHRAANLAVIAPGTGLGVAILYWDGSKHVPIATESGHADFAPRTDQQVELWRFLRGRYGAHVSCERVSSGAGLGDIYAFLRAASGVAEPAWLRDRLASGDPNAELSEVALAEEDPVCVEALGLYCEILGAEAGNLALRSLALGGVILGGGIPPRILPALRNGRFLTAFAAKGRFTELLQGLEVRVALEPRAPVIGAARLLLADRRAGDRG